MPLLLVCSILFFIYSFINLAYFIVHANGKKYVRLYSSFILFVLAALFMGYYLTGREDGDLIHLWIMIVGMLPVLDSITDWRIKNKIHKKE